MRVRHLFRADDGAVTLIVAAAVCVVVGIGGAAAGAAGVLVERHRLSAAADASALAAADAATGVTSGSPCASASRLAEANRVHLSECRREASSVTVEVTSRRGLFTIDAVATAGQPSSSPSARTAPSKK